MSFTNIQNFPHTHTYMYIYICICTYVYIYTHMCICMYNMMIIYPYLWLFMYMIELLLSIYKHHWTTFNYMKFHTNMVPPNSSQMRPAAAPVPSAALRLPRSWRGRRCARCRGWCPGSLSLRWTPPARSGVRRGICCMCIYIYIICVYMYVYIYIYIWYTSNEGGEA